MTVDELLSVVRQASETGHGKARVVFDTDAACYDTHLVDDLSAHLEDADVMPDGQPTLILSTQSYHGSCGCKKILGG